MQSESSMLCMFSSGQQPGNIKIMPPKKSNGKKKTSDMCSNYNRGYCKFRDECTKTHSDKVCDDVDCDEEICQKRHPNPCWHGFRCTYFKKKECLYSHVTFVSDDDRIKTLTSNFNTQFKKLDNSVKQLQIELEKKDSKIKHLEDNCKGFQDLLK